MDHALHTLAITEDSLSDKRPCRCATRAAIFSAALSLSLRFYPLALSVSSLWVSDLLVEPEGIFRESLSSSCATRL